MTTIAESDAEVTKGAAEVMKGAEDEKAEENCRGGRVILDLKNGLAS